MKLKELVHNAHDLDYDVNGPIAPFVLSDGETGLVIFTDDMGFHLRNYAGALEDLGMIDENNEWQGLRPGSATRIMERVVENEGGLELGSVSIEEGHGGDEPTLEYAMQLPTEALEMDVDSKELFDLCWSFLATCVNVTDPGTFGSPYIMTHAADVLERAREGGNNFTVEELVSH